MKDQCSIYRHPHKILTPTHHQGKQTDAGSLKEIPYDQCNDFGDRGFHQPHNMICPCKIRRRSQQEADTDDTCAGQMYFLFHCFHKKSPCSKEFCFAHSSQTYVTTILRQRSDLKAVSHSPDRLDILRF